MAPTTLLPSTLHTPERSHHPTAPWKDVMLSILSRSVTAIHCTWWSFHDQFPHHIAVLVCPRRRWSSFAEKPEWANLLLSTPHSRVWLRSSSNLQSKFVPEAFSSYPSGRPLSCPPPPVPHKQGVPLWPLDALSISVLQRSA